jgi:ParB family chromosome partitioning protein
MNSNRQPPDLRNDPRKVLGRGLSSLLPPRPATQPQPETGYSWISIDHIDPNPAQPRQVFAPEPLAELADSIRANGIIQPLIVRPRGERYELIAGERRWRASRLAGLDSVPVVIQDIADAKLLELALIENIQRADLNPIETATAFARLAKDLQISHEEIAQRTGKDRTTITNLIRLLKLPVDLQQYVAEARLSMGQARALLGLQDEHAMRDIANKAIAMNLSVRAVEKMVQALTTPKEAREAPATPQVDANLKSALNELERALGTRVRIVQTSANRGHLEIEYYSQDDLDRIYNQILGN